MDDPSNPASKRIAEAMVYIDLQEDGSLTVSDTSAGLEDDLPPEQAQSYRELHAALSEHIRESADDLASQLAAKAVGRG